MKWKIKKVLFFLDLVPVLMMMILSKLAQDGFFWTTTITLALMLTWHYTEHSILKPRFDDERLDHYVGHMEWPNFVFTAMVLVAFVEKLFRVFEFGYYVPEFSFVFEVDASGMVVSYVLMIVGILLRVWAYATLKAEFAKAPGLNKKYSREGPYRFFKHPANMGFFLISMGMAMGFYSAGACLVGIVFLTPSLIFVSVFEEKRLRKKSQVAY